VKIAKIGLTVLCFLIGSGISVATVKQVGPRPLLQGIILWLPGFRGIAVADSHRMDCAVKQKR